MKKTRKIELLAPAKNLECGIEAINHGADAVYIGSPKFSARSAAGNSVDDIKSLAEYAHQFGAKVYVALNTIIKEEELSETEQLIWQLYEAKVDALIVQDMGILQMNLPPIPLHASTQTDNRTIEKIQFLEQVGFSQIVLARELTIDEISKIASQASVPLEAFIHGSLCVCYSGQCYLSEALSKRSANRGSCAQYCRLPYTLVDSEGETIVSRKHLLSMKDLNLTDQLENMLEAGVSSLKIEGRLKDLSYVKNTVAHYRQKLDKIMAKRPEYERASSGKVSFSFTPNLQKSFNRGYTEYFAKGRVSDMWSLNSPKSIGEPIGMVEAVFEECFILTGAHVLHNGDGLCFLNSRKELHGIRVNRIDGNKIFTFEDSDQIKKGTMIFRNLDHEFEKELGKKTAERKIETNILIAETPNGFKLEMTDENNITSSLDVDYKHEIAQKDQAENIKNNLSKTGTTIFLVKKVDIELSNNWFIPSSALSDWRRQLTEIHLSKRMESHIIPNNAIEKTVHPFPVKDITYLGNVMNSQSKAFYMQHQSTISESAFELMRKKDVPLMYTRHCIKQSMGWCPKDKVKDHAFKEPFYLQNNNTRLRLEFDCKLCEMKVFED